MTTRPHLCSLCHGCMQAALKREAAALSVEEQLKDKDAIEAENAAAFAKIAENEAQVGCAGQVAVCSTRLHKIGYASGVACALDIHYNQCKHCLQHAVSVHVIYSRDVLLHPSHGIMLCCRCDRCRTKSRRCRAIMMPSFLSFSTSTRHLGSKCANTMSYYRQL